MINSLQRPAGASLQLVPPTGASLQLVPNSKFKIHSPLPLVLPVPFVPPVPQFKIHNSEFKIQNSKFKILFIVNLFQDMTE